jgi:hypothetical protein
MSHIERPRRAGYAAITDDTSVTVYKFVSRKERNIWVADNGEAIRVAGHEATRLLAVNDGRKKRYVEGYAD